jgi:hypothetical protein
MALSRMITGNSPADLPMLTKFLRYRVGAKVVTICQPSDKINLTRIGKVVTSPLWFDSSITDVWEVML